MHDSGPQVHRDNQIHEYVKTSKIIADTCVALVHTLPSVSLMVRLAHHTQKKRWCPLHQASDSKKVIHCLYRNLFSVKFTN